MESDKVLLRELTDINDDLLLPWLDLYETAFPPNERDLVSSKLQLLKTKMRNEPSQTHMVAVVDATEALLGLLHYQYASDPSVALLWYFAVETSFRGRGLGSNTYNQFTEQLRNSGVRVLVFEVEIPAMAKSEEDKDFAQRRIQFYQRLGAKLLDGIDYLQYAGSHQPPTPMYIMVHPFEPMSAEEAFTIAKEIFGDTLEKSGDLTFV